MIFGLRSVMVALGFFGVVYCLLSLLVVCLWRFAALLRGDSASAWARLLFAARIFPLVGAALITIAFALPAFWLLEGPPDEDVGTAIFSACTLVLLTAALFRVLAAQNSASRVVANWLEGAQVLDTTSAGPALQSTEGPPLLLFGVSTPRVLASEAAVALLSADELRVAVQHEIGHMRSRDNLKKLLVYAAWFPGMAGLQQAWENAAEFAADQAAISNPDDAVELASALIKLAGLAPLHQPPAFTTGLVNSAALVRRRVQRLLEWDDARSPAVQPRWWFFFPLALVGAAGYVAAHYGQALLFTHQFTEWFIG
jgi:Zn-dependent protease with chaperone function